MTLSPVLGELPVSRQQMPHTKEIQRWNLGKDHLEMEVLFMRLCPWIFSLLSIKKRGAFFSFFSEVDLERKQKQNLALTWSSLPLCIWVRRAVVSGWNIQNGWKYTEEDMNNVVTADKWWCSFPVKATGVSEVMGSDFLLKPSFCYFLFPSVWLSTI